MRGRNLVAGAAAAALAVGAYAVGVSQNATPATAQTPVDLWETYTQVLKKARYIDLTHTITPNQPVWKGFGPAKFGPAVDPTTGAAYTFAKSGFEATRYELATDQFGTQLDPPAHWAPEYPAIDELPATYAVRPLVVISIVDQVEKKGDYHLQVADIKAWEKEHGRIPEGSVVMVRSDWSKKWTTDAVKAKELAADPVFPGVVAEGDPVPAPAAQDPLPRPRAAGHRHHAHARGRVLADAQRLHAGRGRRQPRRGARDRLPAQHRLREVRRRPRRLRPLHRDLPARHARAPASPPRTRR